MIAAILALLSSSAGGAFVGFAKLMLERIYDAKEKHREHERIRDMARDDRLERMYEMELRENPNRPVMLSRRKSWRLGSLSYDYENENQILPVPHRVRWGGFLLGVLIFTYCTATLALIYLGSTPIATFDPNTRSGGFALAWGLVSISSGKSAVATLSAAGLAVWMMSPIVFIMSAWIVGMSPPKR